MKRIHIHIAVKSLAESEAFYNDMFSAQPTTKKDDYCQWLLDDPAVNFSISLREDLVGINHVGIEVDDATTLDHFVKPDTATSVEQCCYAQSEKLWQHDPQGVVWELFHRQSKLALYGEDTYTPQNSQRCCIPTKSAT